MAFMRIWEICSVKTGGLKSLFVILATLPGMSFFPFERSIFLVPFPDHNGPRLAHPQTETAKRAFIFVFSDRARASGTLPEDLHGAGLDALAAFVQPQASLPIDFQTDKKPHVSTLDEYSLQKHQMDRRSPPASIISPSSCFEQVCHARNFSGARHDGKVDEFPIHLKHALPALSRRFKGLYDPFRVPDLRLRWRKDAVANLDLIWMNTELALETQLPRPHRILFQRLLILEVQHIRRVDRPLQTRGPACHGQA
jgi:hypothetical protein